MHIALLGDSIFDNAEYVPRGGSVIDHLTSLIPRGSEATLVAVDGASCRDVFDQIPHVPRSATHLFLSCGGNDALNESGLLDARVPNARAAVTLLSQARTRLSRCYEQLVDAISKLGRPLAVCTVYDAIPVLSDVERTALTAFNDVILRSAFRRGIPLIDLRVICDEAADYSDTSPIEPSAAGAAKITRSLLEVATRHDFSSGRSTVYV
jgi:hypothetical protein